MPQDKRLSDDLEALAEQQRRQFGASPTVEQLVALRAGDLPPEEAERLRDRLAVDPESAAIYLGLGESEATEPSAVDVNGAWREFSAKMASEPGEPEFPSHVSGDVVPFHRRSSYRMLLGLAALLFLGLGLRFLWLDRGPSSSGPFHAVRVTGETFRDSRIEIPEGIAAVEFQILLPSAEGRVVIELFDSSQTTIERQRMAVEAEQEEVRFRVPMTKLEAGRSYQLLVRQERAPAEQEPLIDFRFEPELDTGG